MSLTARPLSPTLSGWPDFVAALREAGLPVDDLDAPDQHFFAFDDAAGPAGYGGYLRAGPDVLLRSIVVPAARRGQGLGAAILAALLDRARTGQTRRAWLLTTDAAQFFTRHGFTEAAQSDAPAAIAGTAQFTGLCPASATLLHRDLGLVA